MNGFRCNVRGRVATGVLAAAGVAVLTAGCGSSSTGSAKSAAASLKRAAYVSTAAPGYKVAMTLHATITRKSSAPATADLSANGSFSPGSRSGEMTISLRTASGGATSSTGGGFSATMSMNLSVVLDGDTVYVKMPAGLLGRKPPDGKPWLSMNLKQMGNSSVPGYGSVFNSGSNFSDPGQYLDFLNATSDGSVKDLGQTTVGGAQATHYQADVDLAKLPDVMPATDKQIVTQLVSMLKSKGLSTQLPVDVWIDGSHHIRRIHITYSLSINSVSANLDFTEDLSDYGSQPAPTVPSPDQTTNLSSVLSGGTITTAAG